MVLFREMTDDDREAVAAIADRRLGESYQYGFETIIAREDCPAIVAVDDGSVIGYVFGYDSLDEDALAGKLDGIRIEGGGSYFESVAVKESYEGRGIGTGLAQQCLEAMTAPIYALAWVREDHYDSRSLLEKLGFMKEKRYERFWYEDSQGKENYCPDCRSPCTCDAVLYLKEETTA